MEQGTFTILLAREEGRIDPSFLPFRSHFSHFPSPFFLPSFSFQKNARENSIFRYETIFYYTVVILNGDSRTTEAASTDAFIIITSLFLPSLSFSLESRAALGFPKFVSQRSIRENLLLSVVRLNQAFVKHR